MVKQNKLTVLLGAGALAVAVASFPVHAQLGNPADNAQTTSKTRVADNDVERMEDLSHANLAEISVGKMALEKGQSDAVKKFAKTLIDDHTKAQNELQKIASAKGVKLPTETDVQHKTIASALQALSGDTFDDQFIKRVGVGDHQRTHDMLDDISKNAKDPQLKAYAAKTIKVVDAHLAQAKKLEGSMSASSGKPGSTSGGTTGTMSGSSAGGTTGGTSGAR